MDLSSPHQLSAGRLDAGPPRGQMQGMSLGSKPARRLAAALLLLAAWAGQAMAQPADAGDWARCRAAIAAAEPRSGIPAGLLAGIALVESGQRNPRTGGIDPWPWAYNVGGEGHSPPSKAAAMAEVAALQARGVRSIDVGCMQVNLMHHPTAFANLEEAFDPAANLRYAMRFLRDLQASSGDWGTAIARYHSGEVERGAAYSRRVALARMGAAWNTGGAVPLPPRLVQNICAPGFRPALLFGGAAEARRFMTPQARRLARTIPMPAASRQPRLRCLRG
jgi:soluble lytic murein transglycosylase-like protein